MTKSLEWLPVVKVAARDLAGVAAVASISYGSWLIYQPAGFIVGGFIVLAGVIAMARGGI
ncbi:MAG: hypothetical protein E5Y73_17385 [Mesorhizobium sp.]|uniref:hypothetical protein n=1 Tax=Mesorhizobium sp. TaxID=1871066 RepID=UPI000FE3C0A7|nr:hypothetical protein [Mesorhizobium sp.]RWN51400.1 MAG: hypothetical protein EOR98_26650 [Mesorhizobium sp.]RWN73177.1 MAG: hypothetical protein EOS01_26905 [Mesorhizobium sp.]RWN85169.1 MAG: hypothetical protein EOS04_24310 [Mesorhizobium sp.]TIL91450.1 MAG: hypothetical protein E5Y73_17385 [Mesorhizobium sp.]